ncbi:MAG: GIY-YIG nuclease family protein [Balneolaceae bacterium]|nr:GIY-YIG nuclease family protein [Balneolaceae bacterium]
MYQVYIIYSEHKDRYYVGATGGVIIRLERHNEGWKHSTKSGIPWELKYVKNFESKSESLRWEKHITPDYSPRNLIVRKAKWKWERKGTVVP